MSLFSAGMIKKAIEFIMNYLQRFIFELTTMSCSSGTQFMICRCYRVDLQISVPTVLEKLTIVSFHIRNPYYQVMAFMIS